MSSTGFVGSGCLFIDRLTSDGAATGFAEAGNAIKFAIKPDAEKKERISKRCDSFGQVLGTIVKPKPTVLTISMDEWDRETLAMALFGTDALVDTAAGTITDEEVTAHVGKITFLAHRNISSVVVTNSSGSTTYTAGTDYNVLAEQGAIEILSGGAITDGSDILVDYAHAAEKYIRTSGSTQSVIKCAFRLNGINQETGQPCIVNVFEAVLMPSGEIDFLGDDFGQLDFEATLVTPSGKTAPYTVDYYDGV